MKCLKRFSVTNNNVCFQFNFSFSRRRGRKYVSIAISGAHTGFDRARIFQNPRETARLGITKRENAALRGADLADAGLMAQTNLRDWNFLGEIDLGWWEKRKKSNRPSFPQTRFNVSKLFSHWKIRAATLERQQVEVDLGNRIDAIFITNPFSSSQKRAIHMIIKLSDSTSTWNTQLRSRLQLKASERVNNRQMISR